MRSEGSAFSVRLTLFFLPALIHLQSGTPLKTDFKLGCLFAKIGNNEQNKQIDRHSLRGKSVKIV